MRLPSSIRPVAVLCFALSVTVIAAAPAHAQTTGTIRLRVAPEGAPPPPGLVTLQAANDSAWSWRAGTSAASNVAAFQRVPPGRYELSVTLTGQVSPGTLTVSLAPGEDVLVEAAAAGTGVELRVVNRARPYDTWSFDHAALANLPRGDSVWALLDSSVPFAIVDRVDGGGATTAQPAHVGSRGASWTDASFSFNGLDVTDPLHPGMPLVYPDLGAAAVVALPAAGAPIDVLPAGAAIGVDLLHGGRAFHGSVDAQSTTPGLVAPSAASVPAIDAVKQSGTVGLSAGGPLGAHGDAFVAARGTRDDLYSRGGAASAVESTDSAAALALDEQAPVPALRSEVASLMGRVDVGVGGADRLRLTGGGQALSHPFAGRVALAAGDAAASEHDTLVQAQGEWNHTNEAGGGWRVDGSFARGRFDPRVPASAPGGTVERLLDGPMPDPPALETSSRAVVRAEFLPGSWQGGGTSHAARVGAMFDDGASSSQQLAAPQVAELVGGLPARVWVFQPAAGDSQRALRAWTLYANDEMTTSTLTADVGVRFDASTASATGAANGIDWKTLSLRVAARWAPGAGWIATGGYSRYRPQLSLALAGWGDPNAPAADVYRWTDANGNGVYDPGELGTLVARAGSNAAVAGIDPALTPPHTDEFVLGIEHAVGPAGHVRATATVRRTRGLIEALNTGVPLSSYGQFGVPDAGADLAGAADDQVLTVYNRLPATFGLDHFLLTNVSEDTSSYDAFEVSFARTTARLQMQLMARAYRTEGDAANRGFLATENDQGVVGELFETPNAQTNANGRLFSDRAYVLKWTMSYQAPGDVRLAAAMRYQDGQPFARIVVVPDLLQGPEPIVAYPNGRTRFSYTVTVDARLEKGFSFGGRRAAVSLDAFNLLNQQNEIEEIVVTGPAFRTPLLSQPPRTFRVGLRFEF